VARVVRALALGIAVSAAVTALSHVGAGLSAGWETRAVDSFLHFREPIPAPEIVLVEIDEDAFQELGERQPLPRRYLAELGDFLLRSGARVVAFDLVLRARTDPREDQALIAMTRRWETAGAGRLVFAALAVPRKGSAAERYDALPPFSPEVRGIFGVANAPLGADGLVRRMEPVLPAGEGGMLPSLSLAVLAAYAGHAPEQFSRALKGEGGGVIHLPLRDPAGQGIRDAPVSLARLSGSQWRIDYAGPPGAFAAFSTGPLIRLARGNAQPAEDNPFRGKIVLVGSTFLESRDFYPTPLGIMPGVEIQAHMIHTLLSRRAGRPPHWALNLSLLMGVCLTVSLLSLWLRPVWVALAGLALIAALAGVSYEAYIRGGYWLDFVAPLVGMIAYLQGSRVLARRRLRSAFGQFVSPEVVDRILREGAALGGELRTVSVLMSDLRGFTTLSERLPPDRISEMMNAYFTEMVEVISARKGIVNDFIGDGILAVYGAPAGDPEHAWHAVCSALEMQAALRGLNGRWQGEERGPLAMGVAVHTGEVFAGNLGSPRRKKYTVLGDTVNTVARMEGLNRDLSTAILISGATLAAVKDRVVVRDRGAIPVKGRAQPVEVFELLGPREEAEGGSGR
jgi:adenylate cyclase